MSGEKIYSDLGKALRAMDADPRSNVAASWRRRGPHAVSIKETDGDTFVDANASFYPDKTVYDELVVSAQDVENYLSSAIQEGETLMPDVSSPVEEVTSVVETFSPAAASTLKQKFDSLTAGQKVAAGAGIYIGGKAALSFVPLKYLVLAGAAYLYMQMQKNQAPAPAATQASQPVAGMV